MDGSIWSVCVKMLGIKKMHKMNLSKQNKPSVGSVTQWLTSGFSGPESRCLLKKKNDWSTKASFIHGTPWEHNTSWSHHQRAHFIRPCSSNLHSFLIAMIVKCCAVIMEKELSMYSCVRRSMCIHAGHYVCLGRSGSCQLRPHDFKTSDNSPYFWNSGIDIPKKWMR